MDVVTHGMMAAVLAGPFWSTAPEAAAAFAPRRRLGGGAPRGARARGHARAVARLPRRRGHVLFCNVFRVRRRYELAWVAALFANLGALSAAGAFSWPLALAIQTPATAAAIGIEMRSATYHGVLCGRQMKPAPGSERLETGAESRHV